MPTSTDITLFYANLIQNDPDEIVVVSEDGNINYANPAAEILFNRSRAQLVGKPFGFPLLSGEMTEIEIVRIGNQPAIVEMRVTKIESSGRDAHLLTLRDITARREAERRIRVQAALIENVSDVIVSLDLKFIVRSWNNGAEKVYGWSREDAIGQELPLLLKTDFLESSRDAYFAMLIKQGTWHGEVIQTRKDGKAINILSSVTLLIDEHGTPTGIVAINQDITERKLLEDEVYQARLRQAEFEHETALLGLKADFISMVSHEFRTPLTVILSSSEILAQYGARLSLRKVSATTPESGNRRSR